MFVPVIIAKHLDIVYSSLMEHALAILEQNNLWSWRDTKRIQASEKQGAKFQAVTPKLLYFLILESQRFGGQVLDHFWKRLGACNEKLKENSLSKSLITQS